MWRISEKGVQMKNSRISKKLVHLAIVTLTLFALAAFPMLSGARSAPVPFATSVNIVNNGSKSIRHVYVSHVSADDWSADLISGQAISPGQSLTLNNLSCDQQQAKVIGEDQDGCFLSAVVQCGSSSTWTITNSTPADCGGSGGH